MPRFPEGQPTHVANSDRHATSGDPGQSLYLNIYSGTEGCIAFGYTTRAAADQHIQGNCIARKEIVFARGEGLTGWRK